jgi:hypothetical protein
VKLAQVAPVLIDLVAVVLIDLKAPRVGGRHQLPSVGPDGRPGRGRALGADRGRGAGDPAGPGRRPATDRCGHDAAASWSSNITTAAGAGPADLLTDRPGIPWPPPRRSPVAQQATFAGTALPSSGDIILAVARGRQEGSGQATPERSWRRQAVRESQDDIAACR